MSFTAEEYRIAARVARADGGLQYTAEDWEELAQKTEHREDYVADLGIFAEDLDPSNLSLFNGAQLVDRLIKDGWTTPEGF